MRLCSMALTITTAAWVMAPLSAQQRVYDAGLQTLDDPIPAAIAHITDSSMAGVVRGLEAFGTRHASQPNRFQVAGWIRDRFIAAGITDVALDSFQVGSDWQVNVVGSLAGVNEPGKEIIIGAHYDAQSWDVLRAPGADDNASGTAAVLEIARALSASGYVPNTTVRFVAFAAEEQGLIGSDHYAARVVEDGRTVVCMQNYDMIGYRLASQGDRDVSIIWYDGAEAEAILDSTLKRRYTSLTPVMSMNYRSQSDSWPFAVRSIKAVFNMETDFSPAYHTPEDRSTLLDFGYAAEVARSGLALLMTLDDRELNAYKDVAGIPDTLDLGTVYVAYPETLSVRFKNTEGPDPLVISSLTIDDPAFSVTPSSLSIPVNRVGIFSIAFSPAGAGTAATTLHLSSNHGTIPARDIRILAVAQAPPVLSLSPDSVALSLFSGQTMTHTITLMNPGGSDLDWSIDGADQSFTPPAEERRAPRSASVSKPAPEPYDASMFQPRIKGTADTRVGRSIVTGEGGPDAHGYRWTDSREPDGPAFRWEEISATGKRVPELWDDSETGRLAIGFPFPFYDGTYEEFYISSNGFIGFGPPVAYSSLSQMPFPNPDPPNNIIAWCWADLVPTGPAYYETRGDELIIQFNGWAEYSGWWYASGNIDAQVVLHKSGEIEFRYRAFDISPYYAIGIEDAGGLTGLEVAFNSAFVTDSLAVRISTLPGWLRFDHRSGTIAAGSSMPLEVTVDAAHLLGGHYSASVHLTTNDPANPEAALQEILHVTDAPSFAVEAQQLRFGPQVLGVRDTLQFVVTNNGSRDLLITSAVAEPGVYRVIPPYAGIDPGDREVFLVTFRPDSTGDIPGTLTFGTNDPINGTVVVPLEGRGTQLLLTAPNGGERYYVGLPRAITWMSANTPAVNIDYSTDDGTTWNPVAANVDALLRRYEWTVPNTLSTQCRVRASSATDGTQYDISDTVFTIARMVLDSGLVAFYPFDGNAQDESGHAHHAYNLGATLTQDRFGTPNSAYNFNGQSTLYVEHDSAFSFEQEYTFSFWTRLPYPEWNQKLIAKSEATGLGYPGYILGVTEGHMYPETYDRLGFNTAFVADTVFEADTWVHMAVSYRAGGEMRAYQDGVLIHAIAASAETIGTNTLPMYIGSWNMNGGIGVGAFQTTGDIDDIRVYNRELDAEEIRVLFGAESVTGVGPMSSEHPTRYMLSQNYPNPFNPATQISFQLPHASRISLKVFDMLGREVAVLVNEEKSAGSYAVIWNAAAMPSGIYFCRMETTGTDGKKWEATKKMMLMK